ncbi:hypothetical protein [Haloferula sp. BvORR071]|uniref:hypothetical protein n=1 Tax=Haloferula sp. BvORR071 TaxID=1396141 RepID=UPI00054EB208|nr:hypothetical protein [Haloferula sp. BvORR071]
MIRTRHLILSLIALAATACGKKEPAATVPRNAADPKAARTADRSLHGEGEDEEPAKVLARTFEDALVSPDAAAREKALEQVAWDGIDVDPELARRAYKELAPDSPVKRKLSAHFAMRLAESDPDAAIEWASGLEAGERTESLGRIAVVISAKDPERGAKLAAEQVTAGPVQDRAVVQVLQRWSQEDPVAATEWAGDFPAGAARSAGLKFSLGGWLEHDPVAAAAWVTARGSEELRLECLTAAAESLRDVVPEQRTARVAAFVDDEIRGKLEKLLAQPRP